MCCHVSRVCCACACAPLTPLTRLLHVDVQLREARKSARMVGYAGLAHLPKIMLTILRFCDPRTDRRAAAAVSVMWHLAAQHPALSIFVDVDSEGGRDDAAGAPAAVGVAGGSSAGGCVGNGGGGSSSGGGGDGAAANGHDAAHGNGRSNGVGGADGVVVVAAGGSPPPSRVPTLLSAQRRFTSVVAALEAALPGEVVVVARGSHYCERPLVMDRGVLLVAEGHRRAHGCNSRSVDAADDEWVVGGDNHWTIVRSTVVGGVTSSKAMRKSAAAAVARQQAARAHSLVSVFDGDDDGMPVVRCNGPVVWTSRGGRIDGLSLRNVNPRSAFGVRVCSGARASLLHCHVSNHGGGGAGVAVDDGGSVELLRCRIVPGSGAALFVGSGTAWAAHCDLRSPHASAVVVADGGGAVLHSCTIRDTGGAGVRLLSDDVAVVARGMTWLAANAGGRWDAVTPVPSACVVHDARSWIAGAAPVVPMATRASDALHGGGAPRPDAAADGSADDTAAGDVDAAAVADADVGGSAGAAQRVDTADAAALVAPLANGRSDRKRVREGDAVAPLATATSLGIHDRVRVVDGRIVVSSPLHTLPLLMSVHESMGQRVAGANKRPRTDAADDSDAQLATLPGEHDGTGGAVALVQPVAEPKTEPATVVSDVSAPPPSALP